jgi:hypothetical protein
MFHSIAKKLLVTLLTVAMVMATVSPVVAATRPVPEQGTAGYLDFISKTLPEQIEYIAGSKDMPEYRQFVTMYVDQFLTNLPTEPENVLTYLPNQGDAWSWKKFFGGQPDYQVIQDEVYRVAKELDLSNPNLSQQEKASRIDEWANGEKGKKGELLNTNGEIPTGNPWIITEGLNVYHAGPLINRNRTINGVPYNCVQRAEGLLTLYRMAGIPAYYVSIFIVNENIGHVEAIYYLNGSWWVTAGRNYSNGQPVSLIDYTVNPTTTPGVDYRVLGITANDTIIRLATNTIKPDTTSQKDTIYDFIIDLKVST